MDLQLSWIPTANVKHPYLEKFTVKCSCMQLACLHHQMGLRNLSTLSSR